MYRPLMRGGGLGWGLEMGGGMATKTDPCYLGQSQASWGSQLTIKAPPTADAICIWLLAQHIYLRNRISALWSFTILETFQLYFEDILMLKPPFDLTSSAIFILGKRNRVAH